MSDTDHSEVVYASEDAEDTEDLEMEDATEDSDSADDPEALPTKQQPSSTANLANKKPVVAPSVPSRPTVSRPLPPRPSLKPAATPLHQAVAPAAQPVVTAEPAGSQHEEAEDPAALAARRQANVRALQTGQGLETARAPASRFLTLQQSELVLKRAFISPVPGAPALSDELRKRLAARRKFVPWGSNVPFSVPVTLMRPPAHPVPDPEPTIVLPPPVQPPPPGQEPELPEGIEPLVLWAPPQPGEEQGGGASAGVPAGAQQPVQGEVRVDTMLVNWLRPHQREGVAFMFDCVMGLRLEAGRGCILADDMGLGKTLQGLTLLWTLVTSLAHPLLMGTDTQPAAATGGPPAASDTRRPGSCAPGGLPPIARRVIIVCPTSLVSNWDSEAKKWLCGRLSTLALCEAGRDEVTHGISQFLHPSNPYKVLIISYETFRLHAERFQQPGSCDLLICDEAHRLKNEATLTNQALGALPCRRRVLLSGTPMQNHLEEFYAMVSFCNPGVLGTPGEFRRRFEGPILAAREPGASPEEVSLGQERSAQLSALVNVFILRRTNTLLSAHLPPKVIQIVCCRLTPLQHAIYAHFLESKAARKILGGKASAGVLPAISNLKKLCNHPKLIYDSIHSVIPDEMRITAKSAKTQKSTEGFEGVAALFPPGLFDDGRPGRGGSAIGWEETSGKFAVAARMLKLLWEETDDRIVIVSVATQTLDLFAALCRERNYPFLRLDGSTSISKREKLVKAFNDQAQRQYVFLLSSKAGGCGLNLVGGNRLLLFDCDWNPAVDKQASGRVWRDGQKKRVYVYRFLASGTIEEKVFQRQISKEGLQALVSNNNQAGGEGGSSKGGSGSRQEAKRNLMSQEELRELFSLQADALSHTYEVLLREAKARQMQEQQDQIQALLQELQEQERSGGLGAECSMGGDADVVAQGGAGGVERTTTGTAGMEDAGVCGNPLGQIEGPVVHKPQEGLPTTEEELAAWGWHSDPATVTCDPVMQRVAGADVSFIFSCQVAGKQVDEFAFKPRADARPLAAGARGVKRPSGAAPPGSSRPAPQLLSGTCGAATGQAHPGPAAIPPPPPKPISNLAGLSAQSSVPPAAAGTSSGGRGALSNVSNTLTLGAAKHGGPQSRAACPPAAQSRQQQIEDVIVIDDM